MIDFTPLAKKRFLSRLYDQLRYANYADAVQQGELVKLIERASLTEFGRKYHFSNMRTYREFASTVPLYRYEDLRPQIMRMVSGEANVLWRGKCFNFAQSSGTTDGKSKYIPITADSLKTNHYQGASDVVSHYLNLNPASRIFSGKGFILGGSFANQLQLKPGTRVGDLSATLIQNINPLVNLFRVPSKKVALMEDWTEKLPALVEASLNENITNLSGVPSWFLTVLKEVMARKGVSCIHEVWPNLEVFFHGGIAFAPYREQYEKICDMSKMHFLDTYNASEGFFAVQSSWETTAMLLLLDIGVFYEFICVGGGGRQNLRTGDYGVQWAVALPHRRHRDHRADQSSEDKDSRAHQEFHQCLWRGTDGAQRRCGYHQGCGAHRGASAQLHRRACVCWRPHTRPPRVAGGVCQDASLER